MAGSKTNKDEWFGYHYTPKSNLREIKRLKGLIPQNVSNEEIIKKILNPRGVFIYNCLHTLLQEREQILDFSKIKKENTFVRFKIKFPNKDYRLNQGNLEVELQIGSIFGVDLGKAILWTKKIPIEWIVEMKELRY